MTSKSTQQSRMVRLGIVGCGVIAQQHLAAATKLENAEVTMVADLREDAARQTAEKFGVKRWTTSASELMADPEVDGVVLALPTCGRTALALEAFKRGKHVLTEKPVAMNAAEVRRLIRARGRRVAACCSSRYRFTQPARAAEAFFKTGALGRIRSLVSRSVVAVGALTGKKPPAWRLKKALNGGGILVNWGCYDLDYVLGTAGWSVVPKAALARAWRVAPHLAEGRVAPGSDAETHVAALVLCDKGIVLDYERAEMFGGATQTLWRISGDKGTLRLQMTPLEKVEILFEEADAAAGLRPRVVWSGPMDSPSIHGGPVADFANAILTGKPPRTTLEQALVVQSITDAIYQSAGTGRLATISRV
jgi:predicted dehydrogenase